MLEANRLSSWWDTQQNWGDEGGKADKHRWKGIVKQGWLVVETSTTEVETVQPEGETDVLCFIAAAGGSKVDAGPLHRT